MRLAGLFLAVAAIAATPAFDPARYLNHIKYLSSDELKGRASGSPELEMAAGYLAQQYKSFGLKPIGGRHYLQAFPVTTSARMGPGNSFNDAAIDKDFIPFNFSSKGKATGQVVFAGYGITAPEYNYDDYAGLDARGKFVVVLRHEPQEFDEKSVFEGKGYTDHAQFYSKASNAKRHGAIGLIVVNDCINHPSDQDDLEPFGKTAGPNDAGLLVVQVKEAVAQPWFHAMKKDLETLQQEIDKSFKPQSFQIAGITVTETVDVEREVKTVHNVAAYLPGQTAEYVIVGAHYDHLGLGDNHSLAQSQIGSVHHGADDNASGTAGVLELARHFSKQSPKPKRGILFLNFAGEELGLLGSGYYATHPELPLDKAVAMINLDMIGRAKDGKLFVGGAGTGTTLRKSLDQVLPRHPGLKVDYSDAGGYGSSDHTSFTARQVPVLFFFSGLHADYHKPTDTWDKIDTANAVQILSLVADIAGHLETDSTRPTFVRVQPDPHSGNVAAVSNGKGGYGPDFGSIPDFAEPPKGVRFSDVRPGSPAAKAGLKPGDILLKFGEADIANLYDFTFALRSHKPGDTVVVEVLREKLLVRATVLLTQRK